MATIPVIAESAGMDSSLANDDFVLFFDFHPPCTAAPRDVGLKCRSIKSPHATCAAGGTVALGDEENDDYDMDDDDLDDDDDPDDDDDLDDDLDDDDDCDPDLDGDEH